jgi:hypothetical protein
MVVFSPVGWEPQATAAVTDRHPPATIFCSRGSGDDPVGGLLRVIYWSVSGRAPTPGELRANGPFGPLLAALLEIYRRCGGAEPTALVLERIERELFGRGFEEDLSPEVISLFEALAAQRGARVFHRELPADLLTAVAGLLPGCELEEDAEWMRVRFRPLRMMLSTDFALESDVPREVRKQLRLRGRPCAVSTVGFEEVSYEELEEASLDDELE